MNELLLESTSVFLVNIYWNSLHHFPTYIFFLLKKLERNQWGEMNLFTDLPNEGDQHTYILSTFSIVLIHFFGTNHKNGCPGPTLPSIAL